MISKQDFTKAMEECVQRWPNLKGQAPVYYSHLSFINLEAFHSICNRVVEDFRSMPLPKDFKEAYAEWKKENWKKDPDITDREEFKIFFNVNCKECGKKNTMCIQEPVGDSNRCRQCYTGLTSQEIKDRYTQLISLISGKFKFKQKISKDLKDRIGGERMLDVDPKIEYERRKTLHEQAELLRHQSEEEIPF